MEGAHVTPAVAIGVGLVQLVAGFLIGRYFLWRESRTPAAPALVRRVQALIDRIQSVIGRVSHDVGEHRSRIEKVHAELTGFASDKTIDGTTLSKELLGRVAEIIEANERLQDRLNLAEDRLRRQSEQIQSHLTEARTDALTELPNRRVFEEELTRQLEASGEPPSWLLLLDIDHFKQLNDRYGHQGGDKVLRGVSSVLRETVGKDGTLARIGGEEFAVIVPQHAPTDARSLPERMREAVACRLWSVPGGETKVSISLGLTRIAQGDMLDDVYRRADEALYGAKQHGRNRGFFHDGIRCFQICPENGMPALPIGSRGERHVEPEAGRSDHGSEPPKESSKEATASPLVLNADPDFLSACDELRTRLSQVIENPPK